MDINNNRMVVQSTYENLHRTKWRFGKNYLLMGIDTSGSLSNVKVAKCLN